jgi:hypothetical protein
MHKCTNHFRRQEIKCVQRVKESGGSPIIRARFGLCPRCDTWWVQYQQSECISFSVSCKEDKTKQDALVPVINDLGADRCELHQKFVLPEPLELIRITSILSGLMSSASLVKLELQSFILTRVCCPRKYTREWPVGPAELNALQPHLRIAHTSPFGTCACSIVRAPQHGVSMLPIQSNFIHKHTRIRGTTAASSQ